MPVFETFSSNASTFIRGLRRYLTAEALMDGVKTGFWVVPLTILIWVYAEQEKPSNVQGQTLQLKLHSASPDRIVSVKEMQGDMIMVDLDGSKAAVEAVRKELNKPGENPTVRIDVPAALSDGNNKLAIAAQVADAEIFKKYRVKVGRVLPELIDIQIDTLDTRVATVKPPPNESRLAGVPTFVPPTVKITAPKNQFPDPSQPLVAIAQIPATGEFETPGQYDDKRLPLTVPGLSGDHVTIMPAIVVASFQIKQSNADYLIRSLPLRYSFTPLTYQDRIVESAQTVTNINVYGPQEQINRIKSGEFPAYATLIIDPGIVPNDKKKLFSTLEFTLPPGVSVKAEDAATPFEFTIKKAVAPAN